MWQIMERLVERFIALANRGRRVHIERRAVLFSQLRQGYVFTVQNESSAASNNAALRLAIDESGRTGCWGLTAGHHFFFGDVCVPPRTRMATTVWSSKVSIPAECSAAALNSESTTQVADFPSHSAMIFSTRPRPNNSPLRLRASRMPSLKNTNISSGLILNLNSS